MQVKVAVKDASEGSGETEMMKMENVFANFSRHEARGTLKFYFDNLHGVGGELLFIARL